VVAGGVVQELKLTMVSWEQKRQQEVAGNKQTTKIVSAWQAVATKEVHRREVNTLVKKIDTVW
jgi:hypothetical protein